MSESGAREPVAAERQKSFLERFFWPIFVVVLVVVIAAFVVGFKLVGDSYSSERKELNDNYVEKIDVRPGTKYSSDTIIIDGVSRYDCSEKDGRLECDDEPKPTPER
ncbi:hypothetical protein GCM10011519_17460 [Marmoricola endophyticus]|uniref:Uncharacterized protein n=1 Tax=Marmoricola endophyticus TaxID=2040280 RepID=A0A917BGK9_9ACTN|nr:hypothetical protein [Marmoricola endophyticus]GGF44126.1 hypothetical protein GCM10011519_17460 [Marmoricola endophyticus]